MSNVVLGSLHRRLFPLALSVLTAPLLACGSDSTTTGTTSASGSAGAGASFGSAGHSGIGGEGGGGQGGSGTTKVGTAIETHTAEGGGARFPSGVYAPSTAFSWEFWFSIRQPVTNENVNDSPKSMVAWGDESGCEDIRIGFGQATVPDRNLSFSVDPPGSCNNRDSNPVNYYPPGGFSINTWYHVVATHDYGTGDTALYLGGVKVASKIGTKSPITRPLLFSAGRFDDGSPTDPSFDGRVDEIRVYSRVLDESEIKAHALSLQPGSAGVPGLIAGWHLDEGSGTKLADYSGNGHDGTLLDSVMFVPGHIAAP